ncbi:UNVERIFIED_CONTAM: (R)-mandelonitrile lyase-like [Sesamum calycinum]|uniref:(R)-mandelonitrile lyase-like n=1 Tax=Sesamum calycinum TaxID=2727403 RepID=A0AAW2JNH8_9LAMI
MVSREGKVFIVKGVKRKDLESAECAMEGLSDRTSGGGLPKRTGDNSTINAGFYSRADQEFYQKLGVNWDLRVVNKSYEWVEKAVVFRPELRNWQSSVRDGLLEAGVDPITGLVCVERILLASSSPYSGSKQSAMKQLPMSYLLPPLLALCFHSEPSFTTLSHCGYPDGEDYWATLCRFTPFESSLCDQCTYAAFTQKESTFKEARDERVSVSKRKPLFRKIAASSTKELIISIPLRTPSVLRSGIFISPERDSDQESKVTSGLG